MTVWPDEKLGPFGPQDKRFPLPGRVGLAMQPPPSKSSAPTVQKLDLDALFEQLPSERQRNVLLQAQDEAEYVSALT